LLQLATAAIAGESLGADEVPDILALGFSSNDLVGHAFGVHSQEVLDITLRTDRVLAQLIKLLDTAVGKDQWLLVLTSDHGAAPTPEYLELHNVIPTRDDHYRRTSTTMQDTIERALARLLRRRVAAGVSSSSRRGWPVRVRRSATPARRAAALVR
jgi:hypothetical protein